MGWMSAVDGEGKEPCLPRMDECGKFAVGKFVGGVAVDGLDMCG